MRDPIERRKLWRMANAVSAETDVTVLSSVSIASPDNGDLTIQVAISLVWPPGATAEEVAQAVIDGKDDMLETIELQSKDDGRPTGS